MSVGQRTVRGRAGRGAGGAGRCTAAGRRQCSRAATHYYTVAQSPVGVAMLFNYD